MSRRDALTQLGKPDLDADPLGSHDSLAIRTVLASIEEGYIKVPALLRCHSHPRRGDPDRLGCRWGAVLRKRNPPAVLPAMRCLSCKAAWSEGPLACLGVWGLAALQHVWHLAGRALQLCK